MQRTSVSSNLNERMVITEAHTFLSLITNSRFRAGKDQGCSFGERFLIQQLCVCMQMRPSTPTILLSLEVVPSAVLSRDKKSRILKYGYSNSIYLIEKLLKPKIYV
jgi:hypothetical protein